MRPSGPAGTTLGNLSATNLLRGSRLLESEVVVVKLSTS